MMLANICKLHQRCNCPWRKDGTFVIL